MLNTLIGNYRIVRYLNSGGVADIYEAQDLANSQQVAIKVLKTEYLNNTYIKDRFYTEARILANLDHPNIVKILFASMQQTLPVMAMEFLQGEDLSTYIKKTGPLPVEIVESFFLQILDAIAYAHEHSVLHRDIKPSNIFITTSMRIKVLDFGIAKVIGLSFDSTGTGLTMGTPAYMSPEQVKSDKSIDLRTDIYSLGITLYTMLVGTNPYHQIHSQYEIFDKVAHHDLPFISMYPTLSAVINKATQKQKDNRYATVADFKNDLISALMQHKKRSAYVTLLNHKKTYSIFKNIFLIILFLLFFYLIGYYWNSIKYFFGK